MNILKTIATILFSLSAIVTFSQETIESLREQITKAEGEILRSKQLLKSNSTKQKTQLSSLSLIQSNIKNRKLIISSLDKKAILLRRNITSETNEISHLNRNLVELKDEYRTMIINGYKDYKQSNYLLFLFSSSSFSEIAKRNEYLERSASFSHKKREEINNSTTAISLKIEKMKKEQLELEKSAKSKALELTELSKDEKSAQKILSDLKTKETSINNEILKHTNLITSLQTKISTIIAEENRQHRESEEGNEEVRALNIQLSGTFEKNKGKLPAPAEGVVTSSIGLQAHPTQKTVKIKNNGINITATKSYVYSVFKGTVVKVFFFQGLNNSVMIRHGSYISVYSNLANVKVKVGDQVATGEAIGTLKPIDNVMNLHFELWKETTVQDPEAWINF